MTNLPIPTKAVVVIEINQDEVEEAAKWLFYVFAGSIREGHLFKNLHLAVNETAEKIIADRDSGQTWDPMESDEEAT